MNLVEGYNGNTLPLMLIFVGACTAVIDLAGGKLCNSVGDVSRRYVFRKNILEENINILLRTSTYCNKK